AAAGATRGPRADRPARAVRPRGRGADRCAAQHRVLAPAARPRPARSRDRSSQGLATEARRPSAEERARHRAAYRGAIAPPSDRRERSLHALRQRLRLQAEAASTSAPAGARRSVVPTAIATSVAIAAAVLFVLWGAMTGVRALRDGA